MVRVSVNAVVRVRVRVRGRARVNANPKPNPEAHHAVEELGRRRARHRRGHAALRERLGEIWGSV